MGVHANAAPPWTATNWCRRWEDAGGGWGMIGDRLAFFLPAQQGALQPLFGEIVGYPDRLAEVRQYVAGRP